MPNKGFVFGLTSVIAVFAVVFLIALNTNSSTSNTAAGASVMLDKTTHDWGVIDINGGNVEKTFTLTNTGAGPLTIRNVKTSCMCTTATIIIGEQRSPAFGMHQKSAWLGTVPAGQTASIQIVFDPIFHGPQGTGPITRLVSLETNDPKHKQLELRLSGNVVKK